jgi:hypothetical protein
MSMLQEMLMTTIVVVGSLNMDLVVHAPRGIL